MKVRVLNEYGHDEALLGLGLSYGLTSETPLESINGTTLLYNEGLHKQLLGVAAKLAGKDGGHNKFLESISVYLDVDAPLYWWKQFDTYRTGVTKQSESTMHTLTRRPLGQEDFEGEIHPDILLHLNGLITSKLFTAINNDLPQGFLQRRIVVTNYKALRHIFNQRHSHKLKQWLMFLEEVIKGVQHPEYITAGV